jgi:hypothetical protein
VRRRFFSASLLRNFPFHKQSTRRFAFQDWLWNGLVSTVSDFRAQPWYTLARGRKLKTMTESASYSTEVQTSDGFRIEVSPDELTVTTVTSIGTWLLTCLTYGAFLYVVYVLISGGRPPIVLLLALAVLVLQYFLVGVQNLRFTRADLEVIDVFRLRPARTRSYKRDDVREIRVGVVSHSRYGPILGLIFEVGDMRFKVLSGLRGREAQKILEELERLGFHLSQDPAMP